MHNALDAAAAQGPARHAGPFALALAAAVAVGLGIAQPAAAQETVPQQQTAPTNYSDEQLESFAAAAQRVQELNQRWVPQIAEAQSESEGAQMRQQALQEMEQAVRDEGLTVQEYNGIYDAAQRDPEVMQKIESHRQGAQ
ncbi:MAG: DUF4168 domain-containing protein [Bacteroidota bacterium]|nr:DUF4168 domain-containing protein [Kiloniellaceae bacterium]